MKEFPQEVQQVVGYALYLAQCGEKHPSAKRLSRTCGDNVSLLFSCIKVFSLHCPGKMYQQLLFTPNIRESRLMIVVL
ncbi:MAG: hypothetical protein WBV73_05830 [Phormidium sp.]